MRGRHRSHRPGHRRKALSRRASPSYAARFTLNPRQFVADSPNVFAGGDAVTGPATVIRAIAAGKVAAANIDEHLGFRHVIKSVVEDIPEPRVYQPAPRPHHTTDPPSLRCVVRLLGHECGMTEEERARRRGVPLLRCDHFGYGISGEGVRQMVTLTMDRSIYPCPYRRAPPFWRPPPRSTSTSPPCAISRAERNPPAASAVSR